MPKIRVREIDMHYITSGIGPDVVMVHGFMGNLAVWHLQIVPQLRDQFRITTYDLRGHGYSGVTPSGYSAQNMAEDLRGLLDGLGIQKALLVGHSFGGDICLYFAHRYPDRIERIVALEPGLAALVEDRERATSIGWAAWTEKLRSLGIDIPEDKARDLDYLLQRSLETPKFYGPARGLPRNAEPLLRLVRDTSLIQDYGQVGELTLDAFRKIKTPTLLIYGENSHLLVSLKTLRRLLPNRHVVLLPGGEHFGPLEHPELLAAHISSFLSRGVPASDTDQLSLTPPETITLDRMARRQAI